MAPIRVALVGLSASAKVTWAADAHLPYLLSLLGQTHYQIVALLNSSIEAAEAAKQTFHLPSTVKAYGDPDTLAQDPGIDLVVVNTRVDMHSSVALPSIRAGKAVYIEWPLTESLSSAKDLWNHIPDPMSSIIGLQGRVAPITLRLKNILASGLVGKVLSSEVRGYGNLIPRDGLPSSLTYFAEKKVGGNPISIYYGHLIDYVQAVLGKWESFDARMQIQRPELKVLGTDGEVVDTIQTDVPDLLSVHGTLNSDSGVAVKGATLIAHIRTGPQFPGQPGLTWTIAGQAGELRLTAPGPFLMSGYSYDGPVTIEHHDHTTDQVRQLEWEWPAWQRALPLRARSVAEMYERYAKWVEGGRGEVEGEEAWPTLQDGVGLMEEFDELYKKCGL